MVQPASAIALAPTLGAIAPPRIKLLFGRHMLAHDIDPLARLLHALQAIGFDGRVADDLEQVLVRPDIVFEGSDVEIADNDTVMAALQGAIAGPAFELGEELLLTRRIDYGNYEDPQHPLRSGHR